MLPKVRGAEMAATFFTFVSDTLLKAIEEIISQQE
jgi:hypothetical protein